MRDSIRKYLEANGFLFIENYVYEDEHFSYIFSYCDDCIILDFDICNPTQKTVFDYSKYCDVQNEYMAKYTRVFRFNVVSEGVEAVLSTIMSWIYKDPDTIDAVDRGGVFNEVHIDNTPLEHKFEQVFDEAFGNDSVMYLRKEFPISIGDGRNAFVDYVVETVDGNYAIEENGVTYHHPCLIGNDAYNRQLRKQNTLTLLNFKVYRFSTQNVLFKDQIIDRLRKYLGEKDGFIKSATITGSRNFELYEHQKDVLVEFESLREKGITSTLVVLPTGTGKSQIIISDLEKLSGTGEYKNVLILTPSLAIKEDWSKRLSKFTDMNIEVGTYNSGFIKRNTCLKDHYDYIVFDEAHHAQAANCKKTLQYFNPKFLVGLTATPERLDQKKLEEIFGQYETKLTLKEAIEKKVVSNVRVYRLISNIDLSEVRYNGKDYNYSDLEKNLVIDSRNELIVNTITKYFSPSEEFYKQGIVFCVNIDHVKKVEKMLNESGIKAKAVIGGKNNEEIYTQYKNKEIQFLVCCQVISEGWDCPQTEVVVMARPTLSKVLYLQQLGRGVRNYPGKECLYVVDVVDNYAGKLTPWSSNAVFQMPVYSDFIGVINNKNFDYLNILGLSESELSMQEVDVFTFEEKYKDYLSQEQAARSLFIGTATLGKWVKNKPEYASMYLPIGNKLMPYFSPEAVEGICIDKKLPLHSEETILEDFISFIDDNNLTYSYKLVFLINALKLANQEGEINFSDLSKKYKEFYVDRLKAGKQVDRKGCPFTLEYLADETKLKKNILDNPFEKFERKRFIYFSKDLNVFAINPALVEKMTNEIKEEQLAKLDRFLDEYYSAIK